MYFSDAAMYNQQAQQYVLAAQLQQQQGVIQQQQAQQAAQQVSHSPKHFYHFKIESFWTLQSQPTYFWCIAIYQFLRQDLKLSTISEHKQASKLEISNALAEMSFLFSYF